MKGKLAGRRILVGRVTPCAPVLGCFQTLRQQIHIQNQDARRPIRLQRGLPSFNPVAFVVNIPPVQTRFPRIVEGLSIAFRAL
jgi:hypothetical protein